MMFLYRLFWTVIRPLLPLLWRARAAKGKEEASRRAERYGTAALPRPDGTVIWLHGASVGESLSLLVLIDELRKAHSDWRYVVTTGTVTSAALMAQRLPAEAVHQYIPFDHPAFVQRFVQHWQPNGVLWCESEIWPHLLSAIGTAKIPAVLLNARMGAGSAARWRLFSGLARRLLGAFSLIAAQTPDDAARFRAFTGAPVLELGNLKFVNAPQPVNDGAHAALAAAMGERPVWVFASTHEGEEVMAADIHWVLKQGMADLLTIIAPRHPLRADEVAAQIAAHGSITRRSLNHAPDGDIYLWDTMGEMGTLYDLVKIVAMGGSFVPVGGHNPIEPAQFGCAVICGPHMFNFNSIMQAFDTKEALLRAATPPDLAEHVLRLIKNPDMAKDLGARAAAACAGEAKSLPRLMGALAGWQKAVARV